MNKSQRIKWLQEQKEHLIKNENVDLAKLKKAGEKLNEALDKKRKIVILTKKQLSSELRSELGSELRSELGELWYELLWSSWEYYETVWILFIAKLYPDNSTIKRNKKKIVALQALHNARCGYLWISKEKIYLLPMPKLKKVEGKYKIDWE